MGNLNKVFLIGRICYDIELKTISNGNSVVNVSLATNEYWKDQSGNNQERTTFHRLVLWGNQAENLSKFCKKGSQIYVEGSLQTRDWEDKDGNKRQTTEVVVRNVQFLDSRSGNQNNNSGSQKKEYNPHRQNLDQKPSGSGFEGSLHNTQGFDKQDNFKEEDIPF